MFRRGYGSAGTHCTAVFVVMHQCFHSIKQHAYICQHHSKCLCLDNDLQLQAQQTPFNWRAPLTVSSMAVFMWSIHHVADATGVPQPSKVESNTYFNQYLMFHTHFRGLQLRRTKQRKQETTRWEQRVATWLFSLLAPHSSFKFDTHYWILPSVHKLTSCCPDTSLFMW